jgi:hypothetical protein
MRYKLFQRVALAQDLPEENLKCGDVATIVEYHPISKDEDGYSLEIFNAVGETIAVITVSESALQPLSRNEVLSVRSLAA